MVALFARDVWPAWTAQDPPPMTHEQLASLDGQTMQYALLRASDDRIGTAWSAVELVSDRVVIRGTVALETKALMLPIRIETMTEFDADGNLDSFLLNVNGVPGTKIRVVGERHGIYFPCELHAGPIHRQARLDLSASRMIGESLRPFAFLPTLEVGQSWRMQLLDPVSVALGGKTQFSAVVARVTRRETIEHPPDSGKHVQCHVVETFPQQSMAWVDGEGRILVQQAEMPVFGRVTVRQEQYDPNELAKTKRRIGGYRQDAEEPASGASDETTQ